MALKNNTPIKRPMVILVGALLGLAVVIAVIVGFMGRPAEKAPQPAGAEQAQNLQTPSVPETSGAAQVSVGGNQTPAPTSKTSPATLAMVNPALTVVNNGLGALATAAAQQQAEQLKKLQELMGQVTSKPFTLTFTTKDKDKEKTQTWTISVDRLKKAVKIDKDTLTVDRAALDDQIKVWSKAVEKKPVDAKVSWSDKENKIVATKSSITGQKLGVDATLDSIKTALNKGQSQAGLVVEADLPKIDSDNLDKLGIKEKISEGVSGYAGSDGNRAHNIEVGADFLDNTLVPPRGTFSFNDAIGPITKERGYADGYAIVGDVTEKDVGGGICQVSTTTFRAAFWAGFNITERHPHAYRVVWYESLNEVPGMDATIYQPGSDFKFVNETDNWLLVSTYAKNAKLRVVFYGSKPDWRVAMTPESGTLLNPTNPPPPRIEVDPKLPPGARQKVDSAHKGFDTSIGRMVYSADGQLIREDKFNSHYVAWPEVYKVGPAVAPTATVNPAASPSAGASPAAPTNGAAPAPATTVAGAAPASTAAPAPATTAAAAPAPTSPPSAAKQPTATPPPPG